MISKKEKAEEDKYYRDLAKYEVERKHFDEVIKPDPTKGPMVKSWLLPQPPDPPKHMRLEPTAEMDAELAEALKDL